MTQEHKELLLKDLCARLPYGVKAYVKNWSKLDRKYYEGVYTVASVHPSLNNILVCSERFSVEVIVGYDDYEIKPYLFPLSSMTDEQIVEASRELGLEKYQINFLGDIESYSEIGDDIAYIDIESINRYINWCYKNHIDINNLISMGLADDATGLNIY